MAVLVTPTETDDHVVLTWTSDSVGDVLPNPNGLRVEHVTRCDSGSIEIRFPNRASITVLEGEEIILPLGIRYDVISVTVPTVITCFYPKTDPNIDEDVGSFKAQLNKTINHDFSENIEIALPKLTTGLVGFSAATDPVSGVDDDTGRNIEIPRPAGVEEGDEMVVFCYHEVSKYNTIPTDWTEIFRAPETNPSVSLWRKTVTESEPSSYTWILTATSSSRTGLMAVIRGKSFVTYETNLHLFVTPAVDANNADLILFGGTGSNGGSTGTPQIGLEEPAIRLGGHSAKGFDTFGFKSFRESMVGFIPNVSGLGLQYTFTHSTVPDIARGVTVVFE